jgi:hypothetical protein
VTKTTTTLPTGSALVAALEATYAEVRKHTPDLPEIIFITGTGLGLFSAKWGHYRRDAWTDALAKEGKEGGATDAADALAAGRRPEIFIAGERLACGAEDTLETILHEAAHALAVVREVKDTSRDFRYHNKRFLGLAEELGLTYPHEKPHPVIGFSDTALTDETKKTYAKVIKRLDAAITVYLDTFKRLGIGQGDNGDGKTGGDGGIKVPPKGGRSKSSRNNVKATCGCGRIIRASKKVLADGPITCGLCGEDFTYPDEEEA